MVNIQKHKEGILLKVFLESFSGTDELSATYETNAHVEKVIFH